jgi:hypothetical protein
METTVEDIDRATYRMPFKWWRDRDTIDFERKQPEMADPENCFKLLSWRGPDGRSYLLNNKNREFFDKGGPFLPPFRLINERYGANAGEDAFVFCPGPSAGAADLEAFRGRLVLAVNSAGFLFKSYVPSYWAVFESNYMLQVLRAEKIMKGQSFLFSPRVAIRWRGFDYMPRAPKATYWVARFEEERLMPHRTPAVATMGAIAAAYWLGAKRCWVIGMDVCRPKGKPYVDGVPFSKDGATNPIEEQMPALIQVKYPGMQLLNCSPHSRDWLTPAFERADLADAVAAARGQP